MMSVVKRRCESPRRKWQVFTLDVSKQVVSCLLVHFANLHLSVVVANEKDQCVTYLAAMLVDVTIGVILSWILLRFFDIVFAKLGAECLVSGNYFVMRKIDRRREFFISYNRWAAQTAVWCFIAVAVILAFTSDQNRSDTRPIQILRIQRYRLFDRSTR